MSQDQQDKSGKSFLADFDWQRAARIDEAFYQAHPELRDVWTHTPKSSEECNRRCGRLACWVHVSPGAYTLHWCKECAWTYCLKEHPR